MTVDKKKYLALGKKFDEQVTKDWLGNSDGASLVFLDGNNPDLNTVLRTMNCFALLQNIKSLMKLASDEARIFLHLRAATTWTTGVAYTHAFDDLDGVFYMHNGMIKNPAGLAVDSFRLVAEFRHGSRDLLERLTKENESFANIFRIDSNSYEYSVIRLVVGSLYTDGKGNFSTHAISNIKKAVEPNSVSEFFMHLDERYSDIEDEIAQEYAEFKLLPGYY
jgi:predicted glutamine amidotransferase